MQVVEDVEKGVLRLGHAGKLLCVINDEHINSLIEIDEVIDRIIAHRVRVLHLEEVGRHIQHPFLRIQFLDLGTDGIDQVRLSHTRCAIDEQRIENGFGRIERHGLGHAAREFVAFSFYKSLKVIVTLQVRIQFVHQRLARHVLDLGLGRSGGRVGGMRRQRHRRGRIVDYHHVVHQLASFAEHLIYGLAEQVDELLFQELIEELARHLQNQRLVLIFQRLDG